VPALILRYAWRELRRRKARTLANVLGYFLAVAAAVVLFALLASSKQSAASILTSTGTHFMGYSPVCTPGCSAKVLDKDEGFYTNGTEARLLGVEVVDQANRLPSVKAAAPYLLFRFKDPRDGHLFLVGGFDPRHSTAIAATCCAPADLTSGRFLTPDDRGGVILEEAYARSRRLATGDSIAIAGANFTIVGVVNPGIRPGKADVYMCFDDVEQAVNRRLAAALHRQCSAVMVEVASSVVQEDAIAGVKRLLPDGLVSSYACYKPAAQVLGLNETAAWLLTLVIAVCAVALAMKSQLSCVIERRQEIGILKAIGWADSTILTQVLAESLLQALAGGVLGAAAALIVLWLAPAVGFASSTLLAPFPAAALAAAPLLALAGGLVAGVLPAWLAARSRPADALRSL
jgi:putative ABC transport system permease protein